MIANNSRVNVDGIVMQNNQRSGQSREAWKKEDRDRIQVNQNSRSEVHPKTRQIEANTALCAAIAEEKQTTQTIERRKMVRRQANEDLRKLENKLRAAYISKSVTAQSFEAKQLAIAEKAKSHQENLLLQTARLMNHEYFALRTREADQKKMALKQDLQAQMAITEAKRQMEKQAKIDDRKKMDRIVLQYEEELKTNQQISNEQKLRIKRDMDEFEAIQKKWREDHSAPGEAEQRKYEEMVALQEENRQKFLRERKELQARRALKSEEIGKENHKAAETKIKSFEFLTDLLVDERNANEDKKFAQDSAQKGRERAKFRNDLIEQCKCKQRQKIEEHREQEKLHREIMQVVEERDAIKRKNDDIKRKNAEDHRKALLRDLDDKRRLKVNEMKRLIMVESSEQADLRRKKMEVEKLRAEITADHAPALAGFLVQDVAREVKD